MGSTAPARLPGQPSDSFAGHPLYPVPQHPTAYRWGDLPEPPPPAFAAYRLNPGTDAERTWALLLLEGRWFLATRFPGEPPRLRAGLTPDGWILPNGCRCPAAPADFLMMADLAIRMRCADQALLDASEEATMRAIRKGGA